MDRTYRKLERRGIRTSLTRFFSILGIVVIGAGFLAGLLATAPDMKMTVDQYYKDLRFMDLDIKGTLGVTDEDAEALRLLPEVETVMEARSSDVLMDGSDGSVYVTRLYGVPLEKRGTDQFINNFKLVEGRLPKNNTEALLLSPNNFILKHELGETYTISSENTDYEDRADTYAVETYTVVGIVDSPHYMTVETEPSGVGMGKVEVWLYTWSSAFALDDGVYTDLFVRLKGAEEMDSFSDEYTDMVERVSDGMEAFGEERSRLRFHTVKTDAQQEIDDAREEYTEKKAEAEGDIDDAQKKLDDARVEVDENQVKLDDAQKKLDDGQRKYDKAHTKFYKAKNDAKKEFDAARDKLRAAANAGLLDYLNYRNEMDSIDSYERDANIQFEEQHKELAKAKEELKDYQQELDDAQQELDDAKVKIEDSQKELDDAEAELITKLADAQTKIDDAQQELNDLEEAEWKFFDRTDNVSYESYKSNVDKIDAIARVFPLFLFLVAALVALTTMTRMVEEERMQIGTLKALGYSNGKILGYYISYSMLASCIGSGLGMSLGFLVLPRTISKAYSMMYTLPEVQTPFRWDMLAVIAPVAVACTTIATLWACLSTLKEKPSQLMLPKAPKAGKRIVLERIPFIWKHLKFTQKVTCRNIFRYKKRLYMTVIGIAGCTALLLTGFGLRDSINDIVEKQFYELYQFDMTVYLKNSDVLKDTPEIQTYLDTSADIKSYTLMHLESGKVLFNNGSEEVSIYVPKNADGLKKHILLRERKSGLDVPFDDNAVVLTEKLCETLGIQVGDSFTLRNNDGDTCTLTLSGITENYVTAYCFISDPQFTAAFGKEPSFDRIIANTAAEDVKQEDAISAKLLSFDDVSMVQFNSTIKTSFDNLIGNINYIIYVLIIAAGALAMIVMYNLTNINISERKKELATIKVLGFYEKEVSMYIYRETTVLSLLGTVVGFGFGVWLHSFVVRTAEVDAVMFGRTLYPRSFILSAAVTLLFTLLVELIMLPKIRGISMVESMKANE